VLLYATRRSARESGPFRGPTTGEGIGPATAAIVLHTVLNTYTLVIKVLYFPTARLGFQMAAPIGRLELRAGRSRPPTTSQNLCIVLSGL